MLSIHHHPSPTAGPSPGAGAVDELLNTLLSIVQSLHTAATGTYTHIIFSLQSSNTTSDRPFPSRSHLSPIFTPLLTLHFNLFHPFSPANALAVATKHHGTVSGKMLLTVAEPVLKCLFRIASDEGLWSHGYHEHSLTLLVATHTRYVH